jgi:hypothetical protein
MKLGSDFYAKLYSLHQQLIAGDPTLVAQIAGLVYTPLSDELRREFPEHAFPRVDDHMIMEGTADALLEYGRTPAQADAHTGAGVFGFLSLRAKSRLLNQMRRVRTRESAEGRYVLGLGPKKAELGNVVEHVGRRGEHIKEAEERRLGAVHRDSDDSEERASRQQEVLSAVSNERDRLILEMILGGVRETASFAAVLGISKLAIDEQRKIVKQHKDRIKTAAKRTRDKKRSGPKPRGRPRRGGGGASV